MVFKDSADVTKATTQMYLADMNRAKLWK